MPSKTEPETKVVKYTVDIGTNLFFALFFVLAVVLVALVSEYLPR